MTNHRHPPVRVFHLDGDDPDSGKVGARVFVERYMGGAWACYEPTEGVVELAGVRDDPEYITEILPRMLAHEFLHHLLRTELEPAEGLVACIKLDNIDTAETPLCP